MSNFLIFKAAFNNSATPAIGTYTAEGATAQFNLNTSISPDYYLYNTADNTAVQWFVPTAETTDFEFVAGILTRQWTNRVTYFIIADSTGTTRMRMWSQYGNWHFENSDSIDSSGSEYIGVINPTTSGGFGVFHQFRVRVHKLTETTSSVKVYVDGVLRLDATAQFSLITCAKLGFVGGVSTWGPGSSAGIKNVYVYDLSEKIVVDRGILSEAFNKFISWNKNIFAAKADYIPRSGGNVFSGTTLYHINSNSFLGICGGNTWSSGGLIELMGEGNSSYKGFIRIQPALSNSTFKTMNLEPNGTWTWTGSAVQITSDQRLKQQISEIDDKLLDAWEDVELSQFKYNDAVDEKGDKARLHTGYVVQQIDKACKDHNVDISQYGLFCHEEYPEETEEVEVEQKDGTKTKELKVKRKADEHYSLRYTEALVVECAYLRRENSRLKENLASLEERLEKLEEAENQEK